MQVNEVEKVIVVKSLSLGLSMLLPFKHGVCI